MNKQTTTDATAVTAAVSILPAVSNGIKKIKRRAENIDIEITRIFILSDISTLLNPDFQCFTIN
jgi:hypothetical protein